MFSTRLLPLLGLALLAACGGEAPTAAPAASTGGKSGVRSQIEAAVRKHLARRSDLDMSAMDLTIQDVQVADGEADATVGFQVKDAPESAMSMQYHLVRQGEEWIVQPNAGAGHGAAPAPPTANPPAQPLPPGHPPVAQ